MYTIGSFLREEELTGLKLMTDTADLQAEITNINIIDNPDSYDWLSSGDFLLTTGYFSGMMRLCSGSLYGSFRNWAVWALPSKPAVIWM